MAHFKKALEIQPDFAEAHNNLGKVLLQKGQVHEALTHFRAALKIQPDDPDTLSNLAWALATWPEESVRNGTRAIDLAQRANRLSGSRDPVILRTLAAAYAEGGRFADAVTAARRALQLADAQSNTALADALRSQIKLYQAGSPFRDTVQAPRSAN
jgi:Flp pilus assembly protein TadD